MTSQAISDQKVRVARGVASYHKELFLRCQIEIVDADAPTQFFSCIFTDCTFNPPIVTDGRVNTVWDRRMLSCVVNTRTGYG